MSDHLGKNEQTLQARNGSNGIGTGRVFRAAPETVRRWHDWLATGPKGGPPSGVVLSMMCQRCRKICRCLPDRCAP